MNNPLVAGRTCYHGGDFGDAVYSLPVVRYSGGRLILRGNGTNCANSMTLERARVLMPLIEAQAYVSEVRFEDRAEVGAGIDLDAARTQDETWKVYPLPVRYCRFHRVPAEEVERQWLVAPPTPTQPVVIHYSGRYPNDLFPWKRVRDKYRKVAVLVGEEKEHRDFMQMASWDDLTYIPTKSFLDLASVIAGSKLFIGNQSSAFAVAEGLKHRAIQVSCSNVLQRDCILPRPNAWFYIDRFEEGDDPPDV